MTGAAERDHSLPAARAFVVQLRGEAEITRGHWIGRIAHVVSGQTAHFETLQDLIAFIERMLVRRGADGPHDRPEDR